MPRSFVVRYIFNYEGERECSFLYSFNLVKRENSSTVVLYSLVHEENKKPQTNQPRISAEGKKNRTTITKVRLLVTRHTPTENPFVIAASVRFERRKKVLGVLVVGSFNVSVLCDDKFE